jgi:hypothetical protein
MESAVLALLADAGIRVAPTARGYRPDLRLPATETKVLKPQNIVEMLMHGSRDVGFAGKDWVEELSADVVEVLDTCLDPVELVAAAPEALLQNGKLPAQSLLVASEAKYGWQPLGRPRSCWPLQQWRRSTGCWRSAARRPSRRWPSAPGRSRRATRSWGREMSG